MSGVCGGSVLRYCNRCCRVDGGTCRTVCNVDGRLITSAELCSYLHPTNSARHARHHPYTAGNTASDPCTICPPGTFSEGKSIEKCVPCGFGYTSAEGSTSDADCRPTNLCPAGTGVSCVCVLLVGLLFVCLHLSCWLRQTVLCTCIFSVAKPPATFVIFISCLLC